MAVTDPRAAAASPAPPAGTAPAAADTGRRARSHVTACGALVGALAVLPQWAGLVALARAGWTPTFDQAVIAWRSWDELAGHGPLVGHPISGVSSSIPVFDPGPLLYYVLAIPTRLAPGIGPLVGVALLVTASVLAASIAVSRTRGPRWAALLAIVLLVLQWSMAGQLGGVPLWNPFVPLLPFAAALALGWVVADGRLGWWPALVALASLLAQAHLMYVAAAVGLALVTPIVGWWAGRDAQAGRRSPRPLVLGLLVGVACWVPALLDQIFGRHNITHLWAATVGSTDSRVGWPRGLDALGRSLAAPAWARPPSTRRFGALVGSWLPHPVAVALAVVVLVAVALVLAQGLRRRQRARTALALVAFLADLGSVVSVSGITRAHDETFAYIRYVLWPSTAATWLLAGVLIGAALRRRRPRRHRLRSRVARRAWLAGTAGLAVLLAALALMVVPTYERQASLPGASGPAVQRTVALASQAGQSRIGVNVDLQSFDSVGYLLTLAYQLRVHGYTPTLPGLWCPALESVYCTRANDPVLVLSPHRPAAATRPLGEVPSPVGASPTRQPTLTLWLVPTAADLIG